MTRRIGRFCILLVAIAALPGIAHAVIDPACGPDATSAVAGTVRNVSGTALSGVRIEARQTNRGDESLFRSTTTAADGTYRLCVPHDTYDIRATTGTSGDYATASRAVTTFTDFSGRADFTLEYKLNLSITPQASSIPLPGNFKNVTWTIRSKAPSSTDMDLTLDHLGPAEVEPVFAGASGGWNRWTYQATLAHPLAEAAYFAKAAGYDASNRRLTELAIDPYFVDNLPPVFGPASLAVTPAQCQGSQTAIGFSPTTTTNPFALIRVGVCDPLSNGGRSSLDPYSLTIEVRDPTNAPVTSGSIILNQLFADYLPGSAMMLGTWKFRYTISDNAGNKTTSSWYDLNVTNSGGSVPTISGVQPANLGENANSVVIGSQFTTPMSVPVVAFLAKDADGQLDLSAGSLRVKIYGPDGATQLYDYDASIGPCVLPRPPGAEPCPANSGFFNQGTGRFEASGFSLSGKPPGLYTATASITDHGGNSTSRSWRWILAFAY